MKKDKITQVTQARSKAVHVVSVEGRDRRAVAKNAVSAKKSRSATAGSLAHGTQIFPPREVDVTVVSRDTKIGDVLKTQRAVLIEEADERDAAIIATLLELRRLNEERFERAVEGLMPAIVLAEEGVAQARLNAELRTQFLAEVPLYTSEDIARLAGSRAKNRAQRAHRFKAEERIFSVRHEGRMLFPAFQFTPDGDPKQVIAGILKGLHQRRLSGWEIAIWFITGSSYLGGQRPIDLLDSKPELPVEDARRTVPW